MVDVNRLGRVLPRVRIQEDGLVCWVGGGQPGDEDENWPHLSRDSGWAGPGTAGGSRNREWVWEQAGGHGRQCGVRRWVRNWLRAWRSEPLVLESPLPLPVVRQRLIDGSTSYLRASFTYGGFGGFRVVGRVGNRAVSLQAARIGVRNSWRPVLRGRLEAAGAGTRLVGKLGWPPAVKAFSAVWVGIAFGIFVVSTGFAAAAANPRALLFSLVPLGFVAFFVGLTALCIRLSRGEEAYLRSWLIERLQTAESGVHGYRPWKAGG